MLTKAPKFDQAKLNGWLIEYDIIALKQHKFQELEKYYRIPYTTQSNNKSLKVSR